MYKTEDNMVFKFVHDDGSETAIKSVSSCNNSIDSNGNVIIDPIERHKYSVFISISVGCMLRCSFCYLTSKEFPYYSLRENSIIVNVKEAIERAHEEDPTLKDRYVKLCWMGMGDPFIFPNIVSNVTMELLEWIFNNKYAVGLDGVDMSTAMPNKTDLDREYNAYVNLNDNLLVTFPRNENNRLIVNSEKSSFDVYIERSPFRLFYSLHSMDNDIRKSLMPSTLDLNKSLEFLKRVCSSTDINVIFHYFFLNGVNDYPIDVSTLSRMFSDGGDFSSNELRILRYNQCDRSKYSESTMFDVIVKELLTHVNFMKYQISAGSEIKASCGQFLMKSFEDK